MVPWRCLVCLRIALASNTNLREVNGQDHDTQERRLDLISSVSQKLVVAKYAQEHGQVNISSAINISSVNDDRAINMTSADKLQKWSTPEEDAKALDDNAAAFYCSGNVLMMSVAVFHVTVAIYSLLVKSMVTYWTKPAKQGALVREAKVRSHDATGTIGDVDIESAEGSWVELEDLHPAAEAAWPPVLRLLQELRPQQRLEGSKVEAALKYNCFLDLLPRSTSVVFEDPLKEVPLTYTELVDFLKNLDMKAFGLAPGDRVSCVLPSSAEAAVLIMACLAKCAIMPLAPTSTQDEIVVHSRRVHSKVLIAHRDMLNDLKHGPKLSCAAEELGMSIVALKPHGTKAGIFTLEHDPVGKPLPVTRPGLSSLNGPGDYSLMLFTSGTSGSKKCVPHTLGTLAVGTANIIASWKLSPPDKVCNMMPLFHIGGISRNVLSPALSGGSAIICGSFDQVAFWDIVLARKTAVTWYYGSPTMHQMILNEFKQRGLTKYSFRFIANAADGLLPSLATDMRATYGCTVLPGYGMTECMPITAPPIDYKLDRPGTSGRSIGPELKIFNDDNQEVPLGTVGSIAVRGPPCFSGYEGDAEANKEAFHPDGWFCTGDLGYLDAEGYLYITGRAKEIIMRGGEIVSPFDVEEIIQSMPSVDCVIAFAVPHEVLKETVGVALVTRAGHPEPSLQSVRKWCKEKLSIIKWPQVLVLMPELPKTNTNKPLRSKLAERLRLTEHWHGPLSDGLPQAKCTFHAGCPPRGTPLKEPIPDVEMLSYDLWASARRIEEDGRDFGVVQSVAVRAGSDLKLCACVTPDSVNTTALLARIRTKWHEWEIPQVVAALDKIPYTASKGAVDEKRLQEILELQDLDYVGASTALEEAVQRVWQEFLGKTRISCQLDFFEAGGSSLLAGPVALSLQEKLNVPLGAVDVFNAPTIRDFAAMVQPMIMEAASGIYKGDSRTSDEPGSPDGPLLSSPLRPLLSSPRLGQGSSDVQTPLQSPKTSSQLAVGRSTCSACSPFVLLTQMIPFFVIQPLKRCADYLMFAWLFLTIESHVGLPRFSCLLCSLFLTKCFAAAVYPFVAIALKWIIVGKYKEGQYPIFGRFYLQMWFVNAMHLIFGKGLLSRNLPLYYWLLGANIGPGVKMSESTSITEPDLVRIEAEVALDNCVVSPFAMNPDSCFVLRPITIGSGSCVGVKSVISSGASLPSGTCIGPLSSSHELQDSCVVNKASCRQLRQEPPVWLRVACGWPILSAQVVLTALPKLLILLEMAHMPWHRTNFESSLDLLDYFATPGIIPFYLAMKIFKRILCPFLAFGFAVVVKRYFIGTFTETPPGSLPDRSPFQLFRTWLYNKLVPNSQLCGVTDLCGKHYEAVSAMYRLVGVKVGKRVYWPGSGFAFTEPDLVEIGDYVVFGSRSLIFTSDADHRRRAVRIEAGCNVSDNCVLLPGSTIQTGTVLGSGALTKAGKTYSGGTYVGSRGNDAVRLRSASLATAEVHKSAYAKAFIEPQTLPYFLLPEWVHALWSTFTIALAATMASMPLVLSLQLSRRCVGEFQNTSPRNAILILAAFMCVGYSLTLFIVLGIDIGGKWLFIGRRRPGNYSWDTSSYCQRWQIYLRLQSLRTIVSEGHDALSLFRGSQFMVWYFRVLGAEIGKNVCLYPNGADPMMTEPDMVTIGDGACIDHASLVAHLNTQGVFTLDRLNIGDMAVMRRHSRIQQAATLQSHSVLLEHTLVLGGDTVHAGEHRQGCPAMRQMGMNKH